MSSHSGVSPACSGACSVFDVATRQDEAAAALLTELGDEARPEDHAALQALREALEAERLAASELSSLRHESDLGVARRERTALLLALGVSALVVTVVLYGLAAWGVDMMQRPALLALSLGFLTAYGAAVAILHKIVLATTINRRIVLGVGAILVALVLNRASAMLARVSPDVVLVTDLLVTTIVTICGAIALDRRIAWLTALCVPALFIAAWQPALAQWLFPAVSVLGIAGVLTWRRRSDAPRR